MANWDLEKTSISYMSLLFVSYFKRIKWDHESTFDATTRVISRGSKFN